MKTQISINLDNETLIALDSLATLEHRSRSDMGALLLERQLGILRDEYRQKKALPSLPKVPKTAHRRWDKHCRDKFGG